MKKKGTAFLNRVEGLLEESQADYERAQRELREIDLLIRQSSDEVERLSERNVQIRNNVASMESNLDGYSREEIRSIYSAERDSQLRLFMMRSRVEQLQNKQQTLEKHIEVLERIRQLADQLPAADPLAELASEGRAASTVPAMARVIQAQEDERHALARNMHDGPAQSLTNLILQAEICERRFDSDPERARQELANLKNSANRTFEKVRDFIFELRPMMLDDLGLAPTLRRYIASFEEKNSVSVHFQLTGQERRLPGAVEITLFRSVQELLANAVQHAHATYIQVVLDLHGTLAEVLVEDNGSGFDVGEAFAAGRDQRRVGLAALRERVEVLGGQIEIDSAVGRGTRVRLAIPVEEEESGRPLLTAD